MAKSFFYMGKFCTGFYIGNSIPEVRSRTAVPPCFLLLFQEKIVIAQVLGTIGTGAVRQIHSKMMVAGALGPGVVSQRVDDTAI